MPLTMQITIYIWNIEKKDALPIQKAVGGFSMQVIEIYFHFYLQWG